MNRRITKLLNKFRDRTAIRDKDGKIIRYKDTKKDLKRLWNGVPRPNRHRLVKAFSSLLEKQE